MRADDLRDYTLVRPASIDTRTAEWVAHHESLKIKVFVKILDGDREAIRNQVLRLTRSAGRVEHPNILRLLGFFESEGRLCLVTPFIEGASLEESIGISGSMAWPDAVRIAIQVLSALQYLHDAGVMDGNINSSNIVVGKSGDVVLTELGMFLGLTDWQGPLSYQSPEQIQVRRVYRESDIFSVGVVLYEMLTGRLPFEHQNSSSFHKFNIPQPLTAFVPEIPLELEKIVLQALETDPNLRPESVVGMAAQLKAVLCPTISSAEPTKAAFWGEVACRVVKTFRAGALLTLAVMGATATVLLLASLLHRLL